MLKKLYAYNIKTLGRMELFCIIGMLGAAVLAMLFYLIGDVLPTDISALQGSLVVLYMLLILGIVAAYVIGVFSIYVRFYKSFFTDEGYLTFSFPASVPHQLLSKIFSSVTYMAILSVALITAIAIACFIPLALLSAKNAFIADIVILVQAMINLSGSGVLWAVLAVISTVINFFAQIVLIFTAITLGSLIFTKHKILGSVLFYFISSICVEILSFAISVILLIIMHGASDPALNTATTVAGIVLQSIIFFIGYYLMRFMLTRKLNLS